MLALGDGKLGISHLTFSRSALSDQKICKIKYKVQWLQHCKHFIRRDWMHLLSHHLNIKSFTNKAIISISLSQLLQPHWLVITSSSPDHILNCCLQKYIVFWTHRILMPQCLPPFLLIWSLCLGRMCWWCFSSPQMRCYFNFLRPFDPCFASLT